MDWYFLSSIVLFAVLAVVGIGAILATGHHRERFQVQIAVFLVAFLLRFAAAFAIYEVGLIEVIMDEDGIDSWLSGPARKNLWIEQGLGVMDLPSVLAEAFDGKQNGYQYGVATLLFLWDFGGENRLDVAVLNCFIGAMTIVLLFRTAATIFSPQVAQVAAWWGAVFPSLIIWSAQTIKEPLIILLESIAVYAAVRMSTSGPTFRHLALCGIVVTLLAPLRFYAVYLVVAMLVGTLVLSTFRGRHPAAPIITGLGIVIGLVALSVTQAQNEQTMRLFTTDYAAYISGFRSNASEGGSGVFLDFDFNTPWGLVAGLIIGSVHLLFAPFPWQWMGGSGRLLLTIPEVLVWWWLFYAGVWGGVRRGIRERFSRIIPVLLFLLGFGLLYSMMFGNVGLAYRQRAQLLPWLLIFAAAGLEERWARFARARAEQRALVTRRPMSTFPA